MELTMSRVSEDDKTSQNRKYNLENNNRYKVYNWRNFGPHKLGRNIRYNTRKENNKCVHNPLQECHCNHVSIDRKITRLNSSHMATSYAVCRLQNKKHHSKRIAA